MPLFFYKQLNPNTRLAIWKIEEPESFFDIGIPLNNAIKHPQKRLQHLAGRFLLPFLFPGFPADEIRIADTRKPFLPDENYHFSISHCNNYAAVIVSDTSRVGIDVEIITSKVRLIQHKFLHSDESGFIENAPLSNQLTMLNIAWNAKEALFKWYGLGKVDFSEMLRLQPFELNTEGIIKANIVTGNDTVDCKVHYCIFDNISLAWIVH